VSTQCRPSDVCPAGALFAIEHGGIGWLKLVQDALYTASWAEASAAPPNQDSRWSAASTRPHIDLAMRWSLVRCNDSNLTRKARAAPRLGCGSPSRPGPRRHGERNWWEAVTHPAGELPILALVAKLKDEMIGTAEERAVERVCRKAVEAVVQKRSADCGEIELVPPDRSVSADRISPSADPESGVAASANRFCAPDRLRRSRAVLGAIVRAWFDTLT
jgi:hypothetical protein